MSHRSRVGWAIGGFGLLLTIVYAQPLWTRRNFVGRDLLAYNLPLEKAVHSAYQRGRFPVWSAEISGGRPLLPNPNAGALYPVRMALSLLPFPLAMRVYPVLHWLAAAAGCILLLRSLGASAGAAWLGAATYAFSGVMVSEVFYPHLLAGSCLLPWILWTARRSFRIPRMRFVLLSALFAVDLYAGEVFTIFLGVACALLWILLEVERNDRLRRIGELVAALALAAIAAAPQIVASALWVGQTRRAVSGLTLGEVTQYSLSPSRLLELVIPYPFGATWKLEPAAVWSTTVYRGRPLGLFSTIYVGALGAIAVGIRATGIGSTKLAKSAKSVPGVRFARVLLLSGIALTVLPSLLPLSWAAMPSPIALRNPEKFAVSIVFALSILAAAAFDTLRSASRSLRWPLAVGLALSALAIASALAPQTASRLATALWSGRATAAATEIPQSLAEAALLWLLTVLAAEWCRRGSRGARVASIALLTLIPISVSRKIPELANEDDVFAPSAFAYMQQKRDPQNSFRALGESIYRSLPVGVTEPGLGWSPSPARSWTEHTQALWARGTVFNDDFDSGDFARMEMLRRLSADAASFRDSGPFFGSLAMRWGIRFRGQEPVPGFQRIGGDATTDWDEYPDPEKDIRLISRWKEVSNAADSLHAMPGLAPGEAVIESGVRRIGSSRPGKVEILEKSAERFVLRFTAPDAAWLFVLREYWKFRRIRIDGRPVDCVPAQVAFSAVPVPPGEHLLEWTETMPGGAASRWGLAVFSLVSILALRPVRPREGSR